MKRDIAIDGWWASEHPNPIFHDLTDKKIDAMYAKGGKDRQLAEWLRYEIVEQQKNPMAYFLGHGLPFSKKPRKYAGGRIVIPPSEYPKDWMNDGIAFQNDWKSEFCMMKASRKVGKTYAGAVKVGNFMLKTDADWPCYSGQGRWRIEHREWDGPKTVIVSSFSVPNLAEAWEAYKEVWPREELGAFAPDYPRVDLGEPENGKGRTISFGDGRPKFFRPAVSGGRIIFLLYSGLVAPWMNFKANAWHADEQPPLDRFTAFASGSQTMGDYTPIFFTFSGFKLPDRPDTGAAGPIKRIWDLKDTLGKKPEEIGRYSMDIPSTPDAVVSKKKKKAMYDLYANPEVERSRKVERHGLAVYYPGWEPGAGLCFGPDVWQREVHVINRLWDDDKIPNTWTKWRVIDYAPNKTTAVLFIAVGPLKLPNGQTITAAVMYRTLYEQNILISDCASRIIQMSHNEQREIGEEEYGELGERRKRFEEVQTKEEYFSDLIDSRIGTQKQGAEMNIDTFIRYGLINLAPASGAKNEDQFSAAREWLKIDYTLPHPFLKNEDGTPKMGCPRFFVVDGECEGFIDEIEGMPSDEKGISVIDTKFPHDALDAFKYWASDSPGWYHSTNEPVEDYDDDGGRMPETGY